MCIRDRDLAGGYDFGEYQLFLDHVQGDPFASPSRVRFVVERKFHQFPARLYDEKCKKTALEDYPVSYTHLDVYKRQVWSPEF